MLNKKINTLISLLFVSSASFADGKIAGNTSTPDSHAPIGVMGDHTHKAGEWMISYRFMQMSMEDNLQGSHDISAQDIVTSIPNRFAGHMMQPATLRVVPVEMTTDMHMLGAMYAPSNDITLMLMLNYLSKDMSHITFQGGMGTTQLGSFETKTRGLGDTKFAMLWNLKKTSDYQFILNLGLSAPTGDIDETDHILTPMNMTPEVKLPYPMQLGSGSWDFEPGLTVTGHAGDWGWGGQLKATFRLGENDNDYSLGDKLLVTSWISHRLNEKISLSARLSYQDQGKIDGIDAEVMLPVQTADPTNSGGSMLNLGIGANLLLAGGHRLALEYETTLDQKVNGVQMAMDDMLTLGYQYAF